VRFSGVRTALLLLLMTGCGHAPPLLARSAAPTRPPIPAPAPSEESAPITAYEVPPEPTVHVVVIVAQGPASLQLAALERVATACYQPLLTYWHDHATAMMTLDTRADGTPSTVTFPEETPESLGLCLTQGVATMHLHEEHARVHVVVRISATFA
jgi:hypothetical protein